MFKFTYIFTLVFFTSVSLAAQQNPPTADFAQDTALANKRYLEGNLLSQKAKYPEALVAMREAIDLYKKQGLWKAYIQAQNIVNKIYWRGGKPDEALEHGSGLLKECREKLGTEKTVEEAVILEHLGIAYGMKGYNFLSMRYFERSLSLRKKILGAEDPSLAKLAHNIGIIKKNEGHFDEALDYLTEAMKLKIKQSGKDSKDLISTYNVISTVYLHKHEYEHSLEYAKKALEIAQKNFGEEHPQTAAAYQSLGLAYHYEGESRKALDFLHKAESLMIKVHDANHSYLAAIYNNIAEAYMEDEDYDKALLYFDKALKVSIKEFGEQNVKTIAVYNNIGEVHHRENNAETALEYFQKALKLHRAAVGDKHPDLANIYNLIGQQYFDIGQYDRALSAYQNALHANIYYFDDSSLYANPVWSDTLHFAQGSILISSLLHKSLSARALYQQHKDPRDLDNAFEAIILALKVVEATEHSYTHKKDKILLLLTEQSAYQTALELCLTKYKLNNDLQYLTQAFAISERDKSVILMENLHQADAFAFGGVPDSLIRKEKTLRVDIAAYSKRLSDAKTARNQEQIQYYEDVLFELDKEEDILLKQIETQYPKYHQLKYQSEVTKLEQLQKEIIDEETALLEYFVSDSIVYLFVIDHEHYNLHRIEFSDIDLTIKDFRDVLTHVSFNNKNLEHDYQQFIKSAHHLYEKLIATADLKENIKRLIIVPDGMLNHIPFEVLLMNSKIPDSKTYKDLPYLIRQYAISYSYSATLLYEAMQHPIEAPNHHILAFAPAYSESDADMAKHRNEELQRMRAVLSDLPGAREEVAALEKSFKGAYFYKAAANELEFRQKSDQYGIIHLAMHGKLSVKNPISSGLVFAETGDSLHDNVLYAYEINNIPLKAQLVVLSACETGYGKFENGEGVMSIARSFMYAGTHSLLMTLWTVNDEATKKLMIFFYENLRQGMPKDVALQQAKLKYLELAEGISDHPYLWAGFVALGDESPIKIKEKRNSWWWLWLLGGLLLVGAGVWLRRGKVR